MISRTNLNNIPARGKIPIRLLIVKAELLINLKQITPKNMIIVKVSNHIENMFFFTDHLNDGKIAETYLKVSVNFL